MEETFNFKITFLLSVLCLRLCLAVGRYGYNHNVVAFSAIKALGQNSKDGRNVTFNSCHVNVGNGFDITRSAFIAPIKGLYLFNFNALTGDESRRFVIGLYRNNQLVISAYGRETRWWAMGGNTILLEIKRNEEISLKFMYGEHDLWGSKIERYATFNGYLLAAPSIGQKNDHYYYSSKH